LLDLTHVVDLQVVTAGKVDVRHLGLTVLEQIGGT
jgi:hypothetical protein